MKKRFELRLREGNFVKEEKLKQEKEEESRSKFVKSVGMASELGFVLSLPIVGGILLGSFLDKKFSSYPKLTLSLIFVGVIVSFCNMYEVMKEYFKKENK
jgi:ATP synthase protein I